MRVAWLAPYPVETLAPGLVLSRRQGSHPCSWIVALSEALARRPDIELHLVTESPWVPRSHVVCRGNLTFHVVREAVPFTHRGWPAWLPWLAGRTRLVKRFGRELRRIGPEVVHAHGTEHRYAEAALRSGLPCVISMQGLMGEIARVWPTVSTRWQAKREAETVRAGKYFMCRTAFDSGFVRALNPSAKIFFIHEAMRPVFFRNQWEPRPEKTLLYVGALAHHKGLDLLLEALAKIPAAKLSVIGTGNMRPWRAMCQRLGVEGRVEFLGFCSAEQIAEQHRRAQVFVLPSRVDNSPNSLAEAMVSGMPAVASAVGGIPSLVEDGRTGVLVPPGDVAGLAEAIAGLLQDSARRVVLGQAARVVARARHDPATVAEQTVQAYKEILCER